MGNGDEYLDRAAECIELAMRAKTPDEKRRLLQIAQAWHELAETGTIMPPLGLPNPKKSRRGSVRARLRAAEPHAVNLLLALVGKTARPSAKGAKRQGNKYQFPTIGRPN